jgi:hypothetical protein
MAALAARQGDFGPEDYEALLALDEAAKEAEAKAAEGERTQLASSLPVVPMPYVNARPPAAAARAAPRRAAPSPADVVVVEEEDGDDVHTDWESVADGKRRKRPSRLSLGSDGVVEEAEDDVVVLDDSGAAAAAPAPAPAPADEGVVNEECPVCQEDMPAGTMVKLLPACLHRYHPDCIDAWIRINPTCPVCKERVHAPE